MHTKSDYKYSYYERNIVHTCFIFITCKFIFKSKYSSFYEVMQFSLVLEGICLIMELAAHLCMSFA